ncbi:MAG: N-formylglutamate amidohydrolase [Pseudomonadales bacterium]|nr:N-formylglutamate amidohydrolase [Pseudomonadales bacterium]
MVLHVPHDSTWIPPQDREPFLLDDDALALELARMTDHHTHALFAQGVPAAQVVRAPVSRLVVDVERFEDDAAEPMAARGMGVVYTVTSQLAPLRRSLTAAEREDLLERWYRPHHARLEAGVQRCVETYGRCLVLDCHSFPSRALPYELETGGEPRPDICIGTDSFHTEPSLARAFVEEMERPGWRVALDTPFSGALVPLSRYRKDPRVQAVMVEVGRHLYLHEPGPDRRADFERTAERIRTACIRGMQAWLSSEGRI